MPSAHAEKFNHDPEAMGYDDDVADESNPVRAGYDATLSWVVEACRATPTDVVADLGAGTGNLAVRFGPVACLVCVDVSAAMLAVASGKLGDRADYVVADLLDFVARAPTEASDLDVIATTYAAHHLTDDEKRDFIGAARRRLRPGGRLAIGDLMASSRDTVPGIRQRLDHPDVDELFADEFPWWVDEAIAALGVAGFEQIRCAQVSALSWGLAAVAA